MFKMAIIDDNFTVIMQLKKICYSYFEKNNYIVELDLYENAYDYLNKNCTYDIIFLDIELPDMNGLKLAEEIRKTNLECCLCFISNHSKYALNSYKVHAFDFIEKPFSATKIHKTLNELFAYYGEILMKKSKISLPLTEKKFIDLVTDDIICFEYFDKSKEYFNRATIIYTKSGEKHAMKMKIGSILDILPLNVFCMPHKAYIVNFSNISEIKGNEIIMKNNMIVPLSQKRAAKFRIDFNNYIEKYIIG